jgi:UDP-3-O-[3-hydroxymyristoyl] N-acetylglucosamine deacetylase
MGFQKTLSKVATFKGIGVHTGKEVNLNIFPAPINTGYLLKRTDLNSELVPMIASKVYATSMATTLGGEGFTVSTVEHCLAAANALELDNLIFEVDGPEFPIMDGSSIAFFDGFESAGILQQTTPKNYIVVREKIEFSEGEKSASIEPYMGFKVDAVIDFSHPVIGRQSMSIDLNSRSFRSEIAGARTFGFLKDAEALRARGLGLGGSLDNAIILDDDKVLNPNGLRYDDEFIRHKILDAVGDISTLGRPIRGHLKLNKAGHDLMNKLVKTLESKVAMWTEQTLVY